MAKTLIAYFSRADENYFAGAMHYVKVGNTEIAVQHITELTNDEFIELETQLNQCRVYGHRGLGGF